MSDSLGLLVDSHLHLQDPVFESDRPAVIARALQAGLAVMVVNGTEESDWGKVLALAESVAQVAPCLGLHPWHVAGRSERWLERLEALLKSSRAGIGEIGLDRWIEPRDEAAQEEVFRAQLALARRYRRPVMIHCLRAWGWLLDVLTEEQPLPDGMLIHAFGGARELIEPLLERGACFSFAGNVLDERKGRMRQALCAVPLDRLFLETDAPDLVPPEPYRPCCQTGAAGRLRNEPAHLAAILPAVAALRGEDPLQLAQALWANGQRLFGGIAPLTPPPQIRHGRALR